MARQGCWIAVTLVYLGALGALSQNPVEERTIFEAAFQGECPTQRSYVGGDMCSRGIRTETARRRPKTRIVPLIGLSAVPETRACLATGRQRKSVTHRTHRVPAITDDHDVGAVQARRKIKYNMPIEPKTAYQFFQKKLIY